MTKVKGIRKNDGAAIAEFGAALVLVLPVVLTLLLACFELNQFLLIKASLGEAAKRAARGCAMAYHYPPYGTGAVATGTAGSPNAQGQTVAPSTGSTTTTSTVTVVGTTSGGSVYAGQPKSPNDAWARIRVGSIIVSNAQFTAVYTPASANSTANQNGTVTVTVKSVNGIFGDGDPLHFKALLPNGTISSSATYNL